MVRGGIPVGFCGGGLNTNVIYKPPSCAKIIFLFGIFPFLFHFGCPILYDLRPFNTVHYKIMRCSRNSS